MMLFPVQKDLLNKGDAEQTATLSASRREDGLPNVFHGSTRPVLIA